MRTRYRALDGWRGLAALMVAFYHFGVYSHLQQLSVVRVSFLFVDFFFVLSGFVVAHAYADMLLREKPAWISFVLRRLGRLWPLHLAVLSMFLALELSKVATGVFIDGLGEGAFSGRYSVVSFWANVFLIHDFGFFDHLTWNFPSWSISAEFWIYVVYMLFCIAAVKLSKFAAIAVGVSTVLLSFIVLYQYSDNYINATYDFGMFRCFIGFMFGVVVYKFRYIYRYQSSVIEIATVIICLGFMVWAGNSIANLLAPFVFGLVVLVFSVESGAVSRLLRMKPFQKLGEWSYSVYMIHGFIWMSIGEMADLGEKLFNVSLHVPASMVSDTVPSYTLYWSSQYWMDLFFVCYGLIVVFAAYVSYSIVEVPSRKYFNNLARRWE